LISKQGCGLDCSSAGELWIASELGIKGEDIMFTSNYTSLDDLKMAVSLDAIINLDDLSLVDHLARACRELGRPFPGVICFRLNPGLGNTQSETASNLLGGPTAKFGVPPSDIVECYRRSKALGATRFGLHMMTGSCVMDETYWSATVSRLLQVARDVGQEVGVAFEFVNIGGGLGIPYRPEQPQVNLADVANRVAAEFKRAFGDDVARWPRLCMENGRYVTGPAGWLVTRCNAVKEAFGTRFYGVDACMANLMRPGMYNSYHHITVPTSAAPVETCNVVGTLCENNDWFAKDRALPRAAPGDLFVVHDTGAHSHSMGFQYNSKLRAPEVLLRRGQAPRLIRRRETYRDLFETALEVAPPPRRASPSSSLVLAGVGVAASVVVLLVGLRWNGARA